MGKRSLKTGNVFPTRTPFSILSRWKILLYWTCPQEDTNHNRKERYPWWAYWLSHSSRNCTVKKMKKNVGSDSTTCS